MIYRFLNGKQPGRARLGGWEELLGRSTVAVKNWRRGFKTSDEENEVPERPRVYVRKNGSRFVNADELLRSKRGRAVIDRMRKVRRGRRATSRSGTRVTQ